MVKFYQFTKEIASSSKKPENTHLVIETTDGDLYLVDSTDNTKIYKSTDKGENWSEIVDEDYDITDLLYVSGSSRIYYCYVDTSNVVYVRYIDLTDDSDSLLNSYDLSTIAGITIDNSRTFYLFYRSSKVYLLLLIGVSSAGGNAIYCFYYNATDDSLSAATDSDCIFQLDSKNVDNAECSYVITESSYFYFIYQQTNDVCKIKRNNYFDTWDSIDNIGSNLQINQPSVAYDDDDLLYFVLYDTSDSKNYLYSYSISGDTSTKIAQFDIALMLDRNNAGDEPSPQEKGFEVSGTNIYQIVPRMGQVFKLQDISNSDDFTSGSYIEAITDNYIFVNNGGTIEVWEFIDVSKTLLSVYRCEHTIQDIAVAEIKGNLDWTANQILRLLDDNDVLAFQGLATEERGFGVDRNYRFEGLEAKDLQSNVALDYSDTATDVITIFKAAIDQVDNYLYYDSGLSTIGTTHKTKFDDIPLIDVFIELADVIDGVWYIEPDGKVWLKAITGLSSSGITEDSTTGNIVSRVDYKRVNSTYNYIHLYGKGYVESDGDSKDEADIRTNGKEELIRYYPGCNDLTKLQAIATSLLSRDGVATAPLQIEFLRKSTNYQQVGEELNFKWQFVSILDTATDYIIEKMRLYEDDTVRFLLTNTTFQKGREYIE
jgi:hypothetical protein